MGPDLLENAVSFDSLNHICEGFATMYIVYIIRLGYKHKLIVCKVASGLTTNNYLVSHQV